MAAPGGGPGLSSTTPPLEAVGQPPRIRRLAPEVAEAIAAGEVIERPASVVKELLENSLDAGAGRISVEILGGGSDQIRVVDDGEGMSAQESGLAFERHATSKLLAIGDLTTLSTFGFRGEALASIAAVARVVLVSRQPGSVAGARIEVRGRVVGEPTPVASPPGTSVEVSQLFHLTPARRAFLKSERAEGSACLRVVSEAALGRPDVRFEARLGGRKALGTPGRGDLVEVAQAVLGRSAAEQLVPVDWSDDQIAVVGVVGAPASSHPNRNGLILMVNGRRVHQRALVAAVEGAYRGLLLVGRHPLAVLDIHCDPAQLDVNVHPTKREVRFRDESRFFESVQRACWGALRQLNPSSLSLARLPTPVSGDPAHSWPAPDIPAGGDLSEDLGLQGIDRPPLELSSPLAEAEGWRYLGQAHNRYLIVETGQGIALLDQHAAHEKVRYRRVLSALEGVHPEASQPSQGLLNPLLLELGTEALAALPEAQELMARAGFDLEAFGETTIRCSAVPVGTRLSELPQLLIEVLVESRSGQVGRGPRLHRLAASIACHTAIRFGDSVGPEQVAALLRELAATPGGITCPHGRPAILLLSEAQLLTAFRRR